MRYRFGDFVLDTENYQLRAHDQAIDLRAKAFHVLTFLLKNRHRMVSKDELLDEVWHKQYIADATLNSCIKTVRQALGDDGKNQKVIQTVRGRGYRFVSPVELVKSDQGPRHTISKRLSERFEKTFVGRQQEIGSVLDAYSQPVMPFWVCYIYGPGGIGKTSILKNLCRKVEDPELALYIDCRDVEPTREGLLNALAGSLLQASNGAESKDGQYSLNDISALFNAISGRTMLCFDQFESFGILESWMQQEFFPALPDTVLTVIANREKPKSSWYAGAEWSSAFQMIEVGELSERDSEAMLRSRNLNQEQIDQVIKFARGYPLALELAAMLCRARPEHQFPSELAPIEVVSNLATSVLIGLSDVEKEAVEALSTVHRANEPIVCALLGLRDAQKLFVRLRELPFVNYCTQGITLHDVVRDAIAKDLSYRDPLRYHQYRWNAWRYFRDEYKNSHHQRLWRLTADLIFLIEVPVIRDAYFPAGCTNYIIQPALPGDADDVTKIIRDEEPAGSAEVLERWYEQHAEHFYVARTASGHIDGVDLFFPPDEVDKQLLQQDPVTAAWSRHLKQNPVKKNERTLFFRRWLARGSGDAPSPAQGAFWVDIKRVYMEMRPGLRRLYMAVNHLDEFKAACQSVGFILLDECQVEMDGRGFHTYMVDFGEDSIDGWLIRLVKEQLDDGDRPRI